MEIRPVSYLLLGFYMVSRMELESGAVEDGYEIALLLHRIHSMESTEHGFRQRSRPSLHGFAIAFAERRHTDSGVLGFKPTPSPHVGPIVQRLEIRHAAREGRGGQVLVLVWSAFCPDSRCP